MKSSLQIIVVMIFLLVGKVATADSFGNVEPLSIELDGVPIASAVTLIAQQYGLNVVISGEVVGEISMRLKDVPLDVALNAILAPNGYNYYHSNGVIVVKPIETEAAGELVSHVITLRHVHPKTAKKALESVKSKRGKIVILDPAGDEAKEVGSYRANRILITDFPHIANNLMALVQELDQPLRMILIEVKILEIVVDDKSKLGISWPSELAATLSGASTGISSTSGSTGGTSSSINNAAGSMDLETGRWIWGTLSAGQLQAVLDLLLENGNSRLLSDPHITTLENHEAEIKIQTVIPIPTINRFTEAASTTDILTFYDQEVGISLKVTPRISGDGQITLDVMPVIEDIIGFAGPPDNQKPITTRRSVKTTITVGNGQTAALGGLMKENEIIKERRLPLLGSIPLIGRLLFTHKSKEKTTTDLLILITPTILN